MPISLRAKQKLNHLGNSTLADRQQYPTNDTLHRWRTRLKDEKKFDAALESAHHTVTIRAAERSHRVG
jgi:hypothetical protein